jgi:hypothetical protein
MLRLDPAIRRDPARRWALPDRAFFAAGACHILAAAFLERHGTAGHPALWIRPEPPHPGNHIVVAGDGWAFDWRGYTALPSLLDHHARKAARWWPGWRFTLLDLPPEALVSEALSRSFPGLWLREPRQFLHDALPRARAFLARFPAPP